MEEGNKVKEGEGGKVREERKKVKGRKVNEENRRSKEGR